MYVLCDALFFFWTQYVSEIHPQGYTQPRLTGLHFGVVSHCESMLCFASSFLLVGIWGVPSGALMVG